MNRPITPPAYKVDSDGSVHIIEPKMDRVDVDVDVDEDQLSDTTEPNLFDSASSSTSIASSIVSKANFVTSTPYSKNKIERVVNEEETGDAVVDSIEDARNGGVEDLSSFSISGATLMPPSEPIEITGHTQFETDPETVNMDLMVAEENTERSESPTAKWRSAFSSIFHLLILVLSIVNVIGLIHMYGRILLLEDEIQQLERVCYENRSNYPVGKPESTAIVPFVFGWSVLYHQFCLWIMNSINYFLGRFFTQWS